ncbi:MAG: amidohydrolase family protein [Bdellovibrionota bacterium]
MKAIRLDSDGAYLGKCSLLESPQRQLQDFASLRLASEEDFLSYPVISEGFYDSHLHPSWMAKLKGHISCHKKSAEQIILEINNSTDPKVTGHGWDEESLGVSLKTFKGMLDALSKNILLYRVCGHLAYQSTKGFITDKEIQKLPSEALDQSKLDLSIKELHDVGISSWADLLLSPEDFTILKNKEALLFGDVLHFEKFEKMKNGARPPYLKFFLDGSLGAHTAWLSQSYSDQESVGLQLWSDSNLSKMILKCLNAGYLLAFHAIGDAALDQLLKISKKHKENFERALRPNLFHRIEHLQVCRDDQIEELRKQGIWSLGIQPSHRIADSDFSLQRLGPLRLHQQAYRLKSFMDAGLKVSLGSDAPIVSFDPLKNFDAILNDSRKNESLSLSETFKLYCVSGRQNAGIPAKKLLKNSTVWLSKIHL